MGSRPMISAAPVYRPLYTGYCATAGRMVGWLRWVVGWELLPNIVILNGHSRRVSSIAL